MKPAIVTLFAGVLLAQPSAPPVPPWPTDNKPPSDLHGNYIFFDRDASTIVIVIPGSLRGQPGDSPEVIRVPYHNRFDPQVTVSVTRSGPDQYLYAYSLVNGRAAADAITSWEIAASCGGGPFRITASPSGWHCGRIEHSTAVRQYALAYITGRTCPVLCFLHGDQSPGSGPESISVVSALGPGLTTASASDYRSYPVMKLSHELPDAVIAQLAKMGNSVRLSNDSITLGPRFGADVTASQIATDFLQGLAQLIRTGQLAADSDFVRRLRTALTKAAQTGRLDAADLGAGSAEFEREITAAVKLSLADRAR